MDLNNPAAAANAYFIFYLLT